jgi:hypothetical protein
MAQSDFERTGKLQRKINVYRKTASGAVYVCSTNWHRRCCDAVASVARARGYPTQELFARFDTR